MLATFQKLILENSAKEKISEKNSLRLSLIRAGLFILIVTLIILFFNNDNFIYLAAAAVGILVFYWAYVLHERSEKERELAKTHIEINEEEINRVNLALEDFKTGEEYLIDDHPYQGDLDVFGKHSLFQLLNRAEIESSQTKLANWLSKPAEKAVIDQRQEAAKELKEAINWRQLFQATVRISLSKKKKRDPDMSSQDIIDWVRSEHQMINARVWKSLGWFLSVIFMAIGIVIATTDFTYHIIYPSLAINGIFLFVVLKHLKRISTGMEKTFYLINSYAEALRLIEASDFSSPPLALLREKLKSDSSSATHSIQELAKLTHRMGMRSNMVYQILNPALLLDVHLLVDLSKWKQKYQIAIESWLDVVHETECLCSIAAFSYANSTYTFPKIQQGSFLFDVRELGHPLINGSDKVRNNYTITNKGAVDVITGSNMSGKSTFQRTVGVSMVLAQTGCPVDAQSLVMSQTQVFTSMRTKDNLEERTSSFYAELKRLVQLLKVIKEEESTFFILDEILKGTNSEDRHAGSVALIEKLIHEQAFGLISTHDLELGSLADKHDSVRNFSFNSTLSGDKIIFDYLLTDGVCRSFNASQLMKNMGIL